MKSLTFPRVQAQQQNQIIKALQGASSAGVSLISRGMMFQGWALMKIIFCVSGMLHSKTYFPHSTISGL